MRKVRRVLHMLVPAIGMALVIGAVLFGERLIVQLFLVVAGLLMTESGLWRLAEPILPDERKYLALRTEIEHFTALVRQLNAATVALHEGEERGSRFALEEIRREMSRSVDRMVEYAGRTADDLPPDATPAAAEPDAVSDESSPTESADPVSSPTAGGR